MPAQRFAVVLVALGCFVRTTPAQTPLLWKLEKGQTLDVERRADQKQSVVSKGTAFQQQLKSVWKVRLDVREVRADAFQIDATLTMVEQRQLLNGVAQKLPEPNPHERMQGCVFALVVSPNGRLVEWKGYDDFLKKIAGEDKGRLKTARSLFPEEALKEAFADLFGPLPDRQVAKDGKWERSYVEPIPFFGSLHAVALYVADGKSRIDYTIQTTYELPRADRTGVFKVVKGTIDSDKARGTITFDPLAGRLIEHERSMRLRGTLTIESMDRQQPLEFTSENDLKIRIKPK